MDAERLLKLAALLEKDAKTPKGIKFDMGTWGDIRNPKKPLSCGTTACAMGLAALSGAFAKDGLGYTVNVTGEMEITMNGEGYAESSAAELFTITENEAEYLFTTNIPLKGAKGELAMAKKIRLFVDGYVQRIAADDDLIINY